MQHDPPIEDDLHLVDGIRVVDKPRIALIRTSPQAVIAILVFTLLLAVGIAFALTHVHQRDTHATRSTPTVTAHATGTETVRTPTARTVPYERWSFQATLPPLWQEAQADGIQPAGFSSLQYRYVVPGTTCVVAYGAQVVPTDTEYPRTAVTTPVSRGDTLITALERRTPAARRSGTATPAEADAPFVTHEFAFAYYPLYYDNGSHDTTRNAWVLFSSDDTAVRTSCFDQFKAFTSSLMPYYSRHARTATDSGLIYVETHERLGTLLLFRDAETDIATIVTVLDVGQIYKPTFSGDTLYFVGTNGSLKQLHIFRDTTPSTVDLLMTADDSVNDFTVASGTVEALVGPWCHSNDATCDLRHVTYNIAQATTSVTETAIDTPDLPTARHATTVQSIFLSKNTLAPGPDRFEGAVTKRIPLYVTNGE